MDKAIGRSFLALALVGALAAGSAAIAQNGKVIRSSVHEEQDGKELEAVDQPAWLGVALGELTAQAARKLGQPEDGGGAVITDVVSGSPADDAGLRPNDVVIAIDGKAVSGPDALRKAVQEMKAGDKVAIRIFRAGEEQELKATLKPRPKDPPPVRANPRVRQFNFGPAIDPGMFSFDSQTPQELQESLRMMEDSLRRMQDDFARMRADGTWQDDAGEGLRVQEEEGQDEPRAESRAKERTRRITEGIRSMQVEVSRPRLGLEVQGMTPQLREFFGAPPDKGALIAAVAEDSPAAKAGLRAGDVVVRINGTDIADVRDLVDASREADSKGLEVEVVRDKKPTLVKIAAAE